MRASPALRVLQSLVAQAPEGTTQLVAGGVGMTVTKVPGLRPVVSFPRDAVLDKEHLALAFRTTVERVKAMDLPCIWLGIQPKFVWGQVIDTLAQRAKDAAA